MGLNDKYPKFMKLLATLGFSKNHYKDIKKNLQQKYKRV